MPPPLHEAALEASISSTAAASISSTAAASISPTPAMPPPPHEAALDASPSAAASISSTPAMPPPQEAALDAFPSAAASISSSSTSSVLTFRLHPLVVLKLFNCIREYQQASSLSSGTATEDARCRVILRPPRMCGCVTGVQRGRTVEVFDSFDLRLDPDSGTLDRDLLKKEQELCKKAFPDLAVLGWYSIGTNVQDMQIHQTLMDANGTAFYLLLNPAIKISQKDFPVTIYESVWHPTNGSPLFIFVKPNYTIKIVEAERITVDHGAGLSLSSRMASDVSAPPLEKGQYAYYKDRRGFRMMLLETPSGFAMFHISEKLLGRPKDIWAWFAHQGDITNVVFTVGFIEIHNKSVARDSAVGPGDDLREFILRFCTKNHLIVQDAQLKFVIEKELKIFCWCNPRIVNQLTWGLNYVLHELVPQEKNLTNECYLPLSEQLAEQIEAYGFNISPREINREFINAIGYLNYLEYASEHYSMLLRRMFDRYFPESEDMSDLQFAKAIAYCLHSSEEIVPKDDRYSTEDVLRFIDFIIAAPENKSRTISLLRRIEAASNEDSLPLADSGAVGPLPWVWIAVFGLGCAITIGTLWRTRL